MSGPSSLQLRILELLQTVGEDGISMAELRRRLSDVGRQEHLNRRLRGLRQWYRIERFRGDDEFLYRLKGKLETALDGAVNQRLRAEVLSLARGRCGMCGRTIEQDHVKLAVDHKLPLSWGGPSEVDNLWAICEDCNLGKKNFFASLSESAASKVSSHPSVHVRIGELLKASAGNPVSARLIDFVARQDDWRKRTRELRYLGWKIAVTRRKSPNGRPEVFYRALSWYPWPDDPTGTIRAYEKQRATRNQRV